MRTRVIASLSFLALALSAAPALAQPYYAPPPPPPPYYAPAPYYAPPPPRYYRPRPIYVLRPPEDPWTRRHFYMGVEGVGVAVLDQSGPRSFLQGGGGFNLFIGGRLSRFVAMELGWQPTFHNNETNIFGQPIGTVGLDAITLDFKFFLLPGRVQPYLSVGAGLYLLGDNFSVFAEGPGYQLGAGVDFWLNRFVTLGLKAQYRGVALFDYDVEQDNTYLSLFQGSLNLTVHL